MNLVLLFALVIAAASDSGSFQRVVGGAQLDRGVGVTQLRDGGYAVAGLTTSFGAGAEDVYLVRTDAGGEVLWSQTYGGEQDDNGWAVIELESRDLVIVGFTRSSGAGQFDCLLIGTDPLGEERWSRTYGGAQDDRCWGLAATGAGGFALVGETASRGSGERDCYLVTTDSVGNETASFAYGSAGDDRCFAITQAGEQSFVLVGQSYGLGAGDRDAFVIGVSSDGGELWRRTFGGEASDVGHGVVSTRAGDVVVVGYTSSFASEATDPYLIKLSPDGEERWAEVIQRRGLARTLTGDRAIDGGFCLGGFEDLGDGRGSSALLIKTDAEGKLVWSKSLRNVAEDEATGYTVASTADGGCVLAGMTDRGAEGGLDLLLVKVDAGGGTTGPTGTPP